MVELCLHIYDQKHLNPLLEKFRVIRSHINRLIVSTPDNSKERMADALQSVDFDVDYYVLGVDNKYNDWSGYLELLKHSKADTLIFGNDSIVSRRIIFSKDIKRLFDIAISSERACFVGELDTAKVSVPIDGRSSACWISSYLFGIKLDSITSGKQIAVDLDARCNMIPAVTRSCFLSYLAERRKDIMKETPAGGGKLYAMYLERLMTEYMIAKEYDIVSLFGGEWDRKFVKIIERFF